MQTATAVAALRETLRISEAEHAAERREAARRLSQQAHRFATTAEGLGVERAQIDADVRVRRILNALREKDEELAEAHKRIEELTEQRRVAREECGRLRERCGEFEVALREEQEKRSRVEQISAERKAQGSRLKGQLADARFDLDVSQAKRVCRAGL